MQRRLWESPCPCSGLCSRSLRLWRWGLAFNMFQLSQVIVPVIVHEDWLYLSEQRFD